MVYNLIKLYGENSLQSSYADTVGITTFNATEQQGFLTYLPDAVAATVTEEINGQYDLVMGYPVTGGGYEYIDINRIIACKPNPHSSIQAFRIYKISKPIDGIVEVTANHISYDLNGYILNPFTVTNKTPDEVIKAFKTNSTTTCPFEFSSDVNKTVSKFAVSKPISIREMLGGNLSNELSLIQTCSGEFEFDNLKVSLKQNRGSDNGVRISYGKNLTEFKYDEDSTPFYTGVYPYWSTSKKPDNSSSNTVVTPTVSNNQTFEATAQYGNMNLVLSITKGNTSGGNTTLNWSLYFKIVVVGGYHFNYQNSCDVTINGVKIFSTGNVKAIDINGLAVGATVQLASGSTTVPSNKASVPVSANFIQRQDTRGTWKISGNYSMTGGTEVVTNVDTDDIYYTVTLNGSKTYNYDVDSKYKKLYALDLSKMIEQSKNSKGELIYPGVTPAQLSAAFQQYLAETDAPTINTDSLEVSFVDLAQSTEYDDYAELETVNIGDIVTVEFPAYGVTKSKECVKTEYDVLSDSYITLTLGELTDTLASTIQNGTSLAQRNTLNAEQLANSVNANFNSIQVLNVTASTIQADYVVVNERLTATEASIGSLSADYGSFKSATIGSLSAQYASISNLYVDYGSFKSVTVGSLTAQYASISNLYADYGSFKSLTVGSFSATNAVIESLSTTYATISSMEAGFASINSLFANYASISYLEANYASIGYLSANYITASEISAAYASIGYLDANYITASSIAATYASIGYLTANYLSAGSIAAVYASISYLETNYLTASQIAASYASIDYLSTHYAEIDFANISIANVESLFAKTGIISDLTVQSGHLTGELQFVTLNGDLIEVGTLVADRIVMLGSDGLYYQLNTNGVSISANQTEYNSLHGSVITAQTITADKIYVSDLYAFGATIGTLVIDSGSIHTVNKTTVTNGTSGIFISPTAFAIGNASKYLRYNADGNQNLEITGDIIAQGGSIGGWNIDSTSLYKMSIDTSTAPLISHSYRVMLSSSSDNNDSPAIQVAYGDVGFGIGNHNQGWTMTDELFNVCYDGSILAKKGTIGGWTINDHQIGRGITFPEGSAYEGDYYYAYLNSYTDALLLEDRDPATVDAFSVYYVPNGGSGTNPFRVRYDGSIYATKGSIAGWNFDAVQFIGDSPVPSSPANGDIIGRATIYKGSSGTTSNDKPFSVRTKTYTNGAWDADWTYQVYAKYDGSFVAKKATITGSITANSGSIAGWAIGSDSIYKTITNVTIDDTTYAQVQPLLYAPSSPVAGNVAFGVRRRVNTTDSWTYQFIVQYNGKMTAKDAVVTGSITANSGYIGGDTGWVITTGKIYKGTAGSASGIHLNALGNTTATINGTSRSNLMIAVGSNFGVNTSGVLYAGSAVISGSITATSGTFGASNGARLQISGTVINVLGNGGSTRAYMSANTGYFIIHGTSGVQLDGILVNENTYTQSSSGRTVIVTSGGTFGTSASSKRYKKDILPIGADYFNGLLSVQPVTFKYNNISKGDDWYEEDIPGFIAEDVAEKYPIGIFRNKQGLVDDWNDRFVLVGTLSLLQRLYKRVDELERKLATYD